MIPLQPFESAGTWFLTLMAVIVVVPVVLGLIALANRRSGRDRDDEISELESRVDDLESKRV